MLRRVPSGAPCSQDRVKQAMGRLKRFKRADLEVAGRIGKGAYGGVWQATVLDGKREVVVKVVFPDPDLDPDEAAKSHPSEEKLSSFRREIEVMSVLGQHPNITSILGITADSRVLVLEEAMIDLHQMIKSQKRSLSLAVAKRWSHELLEGVAYLHSINVIHRDLKPSNLLIFKDMTLKLGDFGLAREASPTEALPVRREICTLWYRAPELIMGDSSYTSLIDVWSAGCIMLEMLVGRCPTAGRVEDVCKCPKPTHFNYNSDQLVKIFRLIGTPTDSSLLSRMKCLSHFQAWPTYPCKLEEVISSACCAERMGQGSEHLAQQLARQWTDCLQGMLVVDPALRKTASEVAKCGVWQQGQAEAAPTMPHMSPSSSAGSSRSGRSSSSLRLAESGGTEDPMAPAEKPKLSMRGKRNTVPVSKIPLQPLQPSSHHRRFAHMVPLEGLATERAGDRDVTTTLRRVSAKGNSGNELMMTGRGGVLVKAPKASRTKSTTGVITGGQQAPWPMVRLSSAGNHKSKSSSLAGEGYPQSFVLDSIG